MNGFLQDPQTWVLVGFVIFVAFFVWKAGKPIIGALDDRAARIKEELDEAQRLREEAQHLLAEYQRKQRDAVKEAEAMLSAAEDEAERVRAHAAGELEASLKRREQQALDRIAQAEAQAAAEVRNLAVDLAVAATAKVLEDKLDDKTAAKLVDGAIKELPEKLH